MALDVQALGQQVEGLALEFQEDNLDLAALVEEDLLEMVSGQELEDLEMGGLVALEELEEDPLEPLDLGLEIRAMVLAKSLEEEDNKRALEDVQAQEDLEEGLYQEITEDLEEGLDPEITEDLE